MLRNLFCSALLACAAATSHASTLLSDFETSADGWTPSGFTSTLETDGGPDGTGDGYLRVRDSTGSFGTITNTTKFAGDLSGFYAATLSFDYAQFIPASGTSYLGGFGTVTLSGAGGTVSADIVAGNPTPTWQTP